MPNKFSKKSLAALESAHHDLQTLFTVVLEKFDCSILEGHRDEQRQNQMVSEGKSQLKFPNSKHNKSPSLAVDVVPYPVDWNDREQLSYFAGYVLGVADSLYECGLMTYRVRWGGDWNINHDLKDNSFDDLPHFELITEYEE